MPTPQKVKRRIPQAGGKRAPYIRRFRRAQMAGMYVPVSELRENEEKQAGRATRPLPIKALSIPRAGDVLRGEPNLIQAAAANVQDMLYKAVDLMNGENVAAGGRRLDLPGRRSQAKVSTVRAKPARRTGGGGTTRVM